MLLQPYSHRFGLVVAFLLALFFALLALLLTSGTAAA
jgi:hypothetical protein